VTPALTQLDLVANKWRSDVPSAELVELIPAAEWRGRGWWPADAKKMVTVNHLLRAISSLPCLTDLTISMAGKVPVPSFPRSLRRFKVVETGSDISTLFDAGSYDQIKELEIGPGQVQTAVRACPEITALTISVIGALQKDLDCIFNTCKNLQQLHINYVGSRVYSVDLASFTCLESSPCARSLTSIKIDAKPASGSMKIISRCCPAIEEFAICDVGPADVRVMASLMRLHVLEVRHCHEQELSEAFTALGNAEGATPFTRLALKFTKFDATGLFSSRRCGALRELELLDCNGITEHVIQTLATNVRDSLVVLVVAWISVAPIVPLFAGCRRLERLTLHCGCDAKDMRVIGHACKAPLRFVEIVDGITDGTVRAVVPALTGAMFLDIECSAKAVLQHIIPRCPRLQVLRVRSTDVVRQLRPEVPKHITVVS
jgi:hypothetical protein